MYSFYLVNGPGDSLTAFKDIRNCLWNVPKIDSLRRLFTSGSGTIAGSFIGCSSILTIIDPGEADPSNNLVHDKSQLGDSGSSSAEVILNDLYYKEKN